MKRINVPLHGCMESSPMPEALSADYLQTIPNLCSHYTAGIFPDNVIYQIKAQRQAAVLAPLVKAEMGE